MYEVISLGLMAAAVGWTATIWFVLGSMALGSWLIIREVLRAGSFLLRAAAEWRWPSHPAFLGFRFLGGVLLLLPGMLTQLPGWLILFGPTRRGMAWMITRVVARLNVRLDGAIPFDVQPIGQRSTASRDRSSPSG